MRCRLYGAWRVGSLLSLVLILRAPAQRVVVEVREGCGTGSLMGDARV